MVEVIELYGMMKCSRVKLLSELTFWT